jgi:hypothetical protein
MLAVSLGVVVAAAVPLTVESAVPNGVNVIEGVEPVESDAVALCVAVVVLLEVRVTVPLTDSLLEPLIGDNEGDTV